MKAQKTLIDPLHNRQQADGNGHIENRSTAPGFTALLRRCAAVGYAGSVNVSLYDNRLSYRLRFSVVTYSRTSPAAPM